MRLRDGKAKVLTLRYDGNHVYDEKLIEILDKHGIVSYIFRDFLRINRDCLGDGKKIIINYSITLDYF